MKTLKKTVNATKFFKRYASKVVAPLFKLRGKNGSGGAYAFTDDDVKAINRGVLKFAEDHFREINDTRTANKIEDVKNSLK